MLVLLKHPLPDGKQYGVHHKPYSSKSSSDESTTVPMPKLSQYPLKSYTEWCHDHEWHISSIKKYISEKMLLHTHGLVNLKVDCDNTLAKMIYETSSCSQKRYRFLK